MGSIPITADGVVVQMVERLFCTQMLWVQLPSTPLIIRGSLIGKTVVFDIEDVGSSPTLWKSLLSLIGRALVL